MALSGTFTDTEIPGWVPVKFSIYRTTAYNTVSATFTAMPFDTKTTNGAFDTGNNVDITINKGRFTAPFAGYYYFSGAWNATLTRGMATLYVNGSEVKRGTDTSVGSSPLTPTVTALLQLAANDYVEFYYWASGVTAVTTGSAFTWFTGHLVSYN